MKKQTALDWYIDKLFNVLGDDFINNLSIENTNKIRDLSIQARKMEKQQIMDAFNDGDHQQGFKGEAEQYYKETYES